MNLFAYGTLMDPGIMKMVTGLDLEPEPATLHGYCRRIVRGETYPAIRAGSGSRVAGVLYRELPPGALERLDRFEGELYFREKVEVDCGGPAEAIAYVLKPRYLDRLGEEEWDLREFLHSGKETFLKDIET